MISNNEKKIKKYLFTWLDMNITKWILSLLKICPPSNLRPSLAGLFFKKNKVAVTDSFKLVELTLREKSKSWWIIENFTSLSESDINTWFVIPKVSLDKLKIPKTKIETFDIAYIWNPKRNEDWSIKSIWIATRDFDNEIVMQSNVITRKFPDYETFFLSKVSLKVWLDVNNLIDALNVFKAYKITSLVFSFDSSLTPVQIEGENQDVTIKAIVMPLKI